MISAIATPEMISLIPSSHPAAAKALRGVMGLTFSTASMHNASLSTASVRLMLFSRRRVIMTSSSLDLPDQLYDDHPAYLARANVPSRFVQTRSHRRDLRVDEQEPLIWAIISRLDYRSGDLSENSTRSSATTSAVSMSDLHCIAQVYLARSQLPSEFDPHLPHLKR